MKLRPNCLQPADCVQAKVGYWSPYLALRFKAAL